MDLFGSKPFGIYITDTHVQVVQLKGNVKKVGIRAIGEKEIPPGIVVNGELRKERELADLINELLAESKPKKISQKKCIVALPDSQSFEQMFFLPANLTEEELRDTIDKKIQETIPVPFHEIKYDYVSYPISEGRQAVFVVVVPRIVIAQFYEALKVFCGLDPIRMEPESVSLFRNLPVEFDPNKGTIIVYKKRDYIKWTSFWGHLIIDSNSIPVTGDPKIGENLNVDLRKSIEFFKENTGQEVGKVILDTRLFNLSTLQTNIEKDFKIPVEKLTQYRLDLSKTGMTDYNKFNIVTGAALAGIKVRTAMPIDLMKKEPVKKVKKKK